mgnify:CR=1 FL=1
MDEVLGILLVAGGQLAFVDVIEYAIIEVNCICSFAYSSEDDGLPTHPSGGAPSGPRLPQVFKYSQGLLCSVRK